MFGDYSRGQQHVGDSTTKLMARVSINQPAPVTPRTNTATPDAYSVDKDNQTVVITLPSTLKKKTPTSCRRAQNKAPRCCRPQKNSSASLKGVSLKLHKGQRQTKGLVAAAPGSRFEHA